MQKEWLDTPLLYGMGTPQKRGWPTCRGGKGTMREKGKEKREGRGREGEGKRGRGGGRGGRGRNQFNAINS